MLDFHADLQSSGKMGQCAESMIEAESFEGWIRTRHRRLSGEVLLLLR